MRKVTSCKEAILFISTGKRTLPTSSHAWMPSVGKRRAINSVSDINSSRVSGGRQVRSWIGNTCVIIAGMSLGLDNNKTTWTPFNFVICPSISTNKSRDGASKPIKGLSKIKTRGRLSNVRTIKNFRNSPLDKKINRLGNKSSIPKRVNIFAKLSEPAYSFNNSSTIGISSVSVECQRCW